MGAVQKLATVVIIGLVALATVLVVYLADEPNRRDGETTEQEALALERGTQLFITYCLQCHGPAGLGSSANEDPKRIGPPLNQEYLSLDLTTPTTIQFQSDDPVMQERAEAWIRYSITYGKPSDPRLTKLMPAFGTELNVEEINDLVYLIMHGDWDYVYNEAVLTTGHNTAQGVCDAQVEGTPTAQQEQEKAEACENAHDEEYALYPTVPPAATEEADSGDGGSAATPEAGAGGIVIEAQDPYAWSQTAVTVKPGDTIQVVNVGFAEHDFSVDGWGIEEALAPGGEAVTITIPADAAPGDYTFYCSIPGHREGGMVGTITVEAP